MVIVALTTASQAFLNCNWSIVSYPRMLGSENGLNCGGRGADFLAPFKG
jgi:hypothetical protein